MDEDMTTGGAGETDRAPTGELARFVWPCLTYRDPRAAMWFLVDVLGFVETACHTGDSEDVVVHAEARWPEGGGVMFGSANREDSEFSQQAVGQGSVYLVTDDPDAVLARVEVAGVRIVRPMREEDYGSRGFSVADAEGNLWSLGTYRGAPLPA